MLGSLGYLNKYFFRYKFHLLGGLAFIILSNLFAIYPAQVTRYTIDYLGEALKINQVFSQSNFLPVLFQAFVAVFFIFFVLIISTTIIKGIFLFFMRQTIIVMSRHIEYDLKNEIYAHYQRLSSSFYKVNKTGDLMARISEDVSQVRMYVGPAVMYALNLIVLFILVISVMWQVNSQLTLLVLLPLPFLSLGVYLVSNLINKRSMAVQRQVSKIASYSQSSFAGIRIIKSYNRENQNIREFLTESLTFKSLAYQLMKIDVLFAPIITLLIGASTVITIYIGGKQFIVGQITLGNIAEFVIYVNMLTWPVTSIGWVSSIIQKAAVSQQRINEFLNTKPEIVSGNIPYNAAAEILIKFEHVSFTYPESGIVALKNISFQLKRGQTLGITGKTGSGKSTIAHLITRSYDIAEGKITIGDVPIKQINLDQFLGKTGIVPQDVFLFSDSIYNNIVFGLPTALKRNKEAVFKAAEDAAVLDDIMSFSKQFDTVVGERGITLSGGQKQRVSIARVLIKQPDLIILDDCLSAVDTKTENQILNNLYSTVSQSTAVLISHRISTIQQANHIIVLDNGEIAEQGTHKSLLLLGGLYTELYAAQIKEKQESV
jgi:ATP-binding cassette subfamily B protein